MSQALAILTQLQEINASGERWEEAQLTENQYFLCADVHKQRLSFLKGDNNLFFLTIEIIEYDAYQLHMCNLYKQVLTCDVFTSVQFSHSVVSDSSRPHESQHAMPPCSSPTPGVHSDSRPSSQ